MEYLDIFGRRDIFGRKFTSRAVESLGTLVPEASLDFSTPLRAALSQLSHAVKNQGKPLVPG